MSALVVLALIVLAFGGGLQTAAITILVYLVVSNLVGLLSDGA